MKMLRVKHEFGSMEEALAYLSVRGWVLIGHTSGGTSILRGVDGLRGVRCSHGNTWVIVRDQRFLCGLVGEQAS